MKKLLIILVALILEPSLAAAQPPPPPPPEVKFPRCERMRERIKSLKIWKITELLELDSESAALFFPKYRDYAGEIDSLERSQDRLFEQLLSTADSGADADEIEGLIESIVKIDVERLEKRSAFLHECRDVLSESQRAKLLLFERNFPRKMRRAIEEMQQGLPPMPRSPGSVPGGRPHRMHP